MSGASSIRDLRNHFPKIRKIVETQGEVLLSENGRIRYRLTLHTVQPATTAKPIDYLARLTGYQPAALTSTQARALHTENRGDR